MSNPKDQPENQNQPPESLLNQNQPPPYMNLGPNPELNIDPNLSQPGYIVKGGDGEDVAVVEARARKAALQDAFLVAKEEYNQRGRRNAPTAKRIMDGIQLLIEKTK